MTSGLKRRVKTAILIGIPILFLVFFTDLTRTCFLVLISILASWEYLTLTYGDAKKSKSAGVSFLTGLALIFLVHFFPATFVYLLILSLVFNLILIYNLFNEDKSILGTYPWFWNVAYIFLPLVLFISYSGKDSFGPLLISVLLLIWISDISAYFVGKSTGKRKLYPKVSPGKTVEGFLGAGLITVIFSYFFYSFYSFYNVQTWALIGLVIWLFGSIGDLVESKLKRQIGIKDSAETLPGHGGFLDRFDGFIFCIPFVLVIDYYFNNF